MNANLWPTEDQKKRAIELYQAGFSARSAAKEVGLSYQSVINYCREAGVPIRPPHVNHSRKMQSLTQP